MTITANELGLIPQPAAVTVDAGVWTFPTHVRLDVEHGLEDARTVLTDLLGALGRVVSPSTPLGQRADIALRLDSSLPDDGYRLRVTSETPAGVGSADLGRDAGAAGENATPGPGILITASTTAGAITAVATLRQLIGPAAFRSVPVSDAPIELPAVDILDQPRFGYRGVMLDVARTFLPKSTVLRFIEHAAAHKLNVLHLHLTDDQGWRIESPAYPLLTEVGAWRTESPRGHRRQLEFDNTPHGGFYTRDDLREIVAFARTRGITVLPEIDIPGHSQAAIAAYPWLGAGAERLGVWTNYGINPVALNPNERALDFYRTVLDELLEIFDSPWISLGGDEVLPYHWEANPEIVAQARGLGLDSVSELHTWFVSQLASHVIGRGRRAVVWDEVSGSRLPREVIVDSWRGREGGVEGIKAGHDVIMCPEHELYLDHRAAPGLNEPNPVGTVHTVEDVYLFDPEDAALTAALGEPGAGRLLGAQANVWTEYLNDQRRVDFAAYPRLAAFAEAVWSPRSAIDLDSFMTRLREHHLPRLAAAGIEFRPLDGPLPWQQRPAETGWPLKIDSDGAVVRAEVGER